MVRGILLENQIDARDRTVEAFGGIRAAIECIEPDSGGDLRTARCPIAAPTAKVEVRHRCRTQPEDRRHRLAVNANDAHVEILVVDFGERDATLNEKPFLEQKFERRSDLVLAA